MWNYVVTAQKPSSVTHAIVGNFTGPKDINLIVSKCTRFEVHTSTPEGLTQMLDVPIYGRIATMELFRPQGEPQDLLFISTERYDFCVLAYDTKTGEIQTRANGNIQDRNGRPVDVGQIAIIDPDTKLIGLHLYDGYFKVIPIDQNRKLGEAFNIAMKELQVIDIKFLYGCNKPTIAVLYQDTKEARHVKTYEVSVAGKEFTDGPWGLSNVDRGASMLVPIPKYGGAIIIGEQTITYHSGSSFKSIRIKPTITRACGRIEPTKYLLGDHLGNLQGLHLSDPQNTGKITEIQLSHIGETSIPSAIAYLDNSYAFIGSSYGDSQLVNIVSKNADGTNVEIVQSFTNLGPIVDFCVVDLDRQGQGQVVTCSGALKDGSLRVVRNGIGITEQASSEMSSIKGLWSLKSSSDSQEDQYLVLSFVKDTHVLSINGEDLEETDISGFQCDSQTIYCGNVGNYFLQITPNGIFLIDSTSLSLVDKWAPPDLKINIASCNSSQVLIAAGSGNLFYLEIEGGKIKLVERKKLEHEISCVNINSLDNSGPAQLCAVGLWTEISVRLFKIPSLEQVTVQPLGGEILPRSVMLVAFEGISYLLCALGDGHLLTFTINMNGFELNDRKKLSLATQQILLNTFRVNGQTHVFAASDRPTVIYSNKKKLLYSNVNLKEVSCITSLNSASFPDSLAIATESSLMIGQIDGIQKLHIRDIPLGEMPRRIAHQPSSNTFCVLTIKFETINGEEKEVGYVRLLHDQTYEVIDSVKLQDFESPCSVVSCTLGDDADTHYFVVGTAFAIPTESEPTKGRLLVFTVEDGKLKSAADPTEVKGAVYSLSAFNKRLLAGINSIVQLYEWKEGMEGGSNVLHAECSHKGHILVLYLATRGDFIVVGDLMKSISLLLYKSGEPNGVIEEIARDYNPNWMTAVEVLDDDTYIGAENSFNIFTVRKNSDAATDEERSKLEVVGQFHVGEFINRFRKGSLVMKLSDSDVNLPTMLFGTVSGVIGVVATLPAELYQLLAKVQTNLTKVIKGVGGFRHEQWRSFSNERKTSESKNFIDGDLIESFLELKPEKMREVVKGLDISVEDLVKRIESLAQALH